MDPTLAASTYMSTKDNSGSSASLLLRPRPSWGTVPRMARSRQRVDRSEWESSKAVCAGEGRGTGESAQRWDVCGGGRRGGVEGNR